MLKEVFYSNNDSSILFLLLTKIKSKQMCNISQSKLTLEISIDWPESVQENRLDSKCLPDVNIETNMINYFMLQSLECLSEYLSFK